MTSTILDYSGLPTNSNGQETVNASQHRKALAGQADDFARALSMMLKGWEHYAVAHQRRYEQNIGDDYVLGPYWGEVGLSIKRLLDGETGGFDCGSLAANITEAIESTGQRTNGYEMTYDHEG